MRERSTDLASRLEGDLFDRYGPMLCGESLCTALGYASQAAFRQALTRRTVPVSVFPIKHRRGKYALVKDVAQWLAQKRASARVLGRSFRAKSRTRADDLPRGARARRRGTR